MRCNFTVAIQSLLNNFFAVNCHIDGLTHTSILEILFFTVDCHVGIEVGRLCLSGEILRLLEQRQISNWNVHQRCINIATEQGCSKAGICKVLDDNLVNIWSAEEVIRICDQCRTLACNIALILERASTNWLEPVFICFHFGKRNIFQQVIWHGIIALRINIEEGRNGNASLEVVLQRVLIYSNNAKILHILTDAITIRADKRSKVAAARHSRFRICSYLRSKYHVLRGERLTILPSDIRIQMESNDRAVLIAFPAIRQTRRKFTMEVSIYQPVIDKIKHVVAIGRGRCIREKGVGFATGNVDNVAMCAGLFLRRLFGLCSLFRLCGLFRLLRRVFFRATSGKHTNHQNQAQKKNAYALQMFVCAFFHFFHPFLSFYPKNSKAVRDGRQLCSQTLVRGSKASRRPSPIKLILQIVITSITPAGTHAHGQAVRTVRDCAPFRILPQEAVGGITPIPRKLRLDS